MSALLTRLAEARKHEHYEKPSDKKRRKQAEANHPSSASCQIDLGAAEITGERRRWDRYADACTDVPAADETE